MTQPTPFHERTLAANEALAYKDWAGYWAVRRFAPCPDPEYIAVRHSAGLLDVSPLFKYDVSGTDALRLLDRVLARDIRSLRRGRAVYGCWCDEAGKVIDDGTIHHLPTGGYRITAAHPSLRWLRRNAAGMHVEIVDRSRDLAALALQGPTSRAILKDLCDLPRLTFFGICDVVVDGVPVTVSRTGFTGDLGYELWVDADHALPLWDALIDAGRPHAVLPIGLDALDMTRIEAGFPLIDVDFHGVRQTMVEAQTCSPFEVGLGWTVHAEREGFIGRDALRLAAEQAPLRLVGLEIDWEAIEKVFDGHGLPADLPAEAWRCEQPLYNRLGFHVGKATSGTWSPLLKRNLALASVPVKYAAPGTRLRYEITVEGRRHRVRATVVDRPFYDPPRKRSNPD